MRHLLLALMIALLPVRGWVGNAMAVDMASQQVVLAQNAAKKLANNLEPGMKQSASVNALASMPEDCPMLSKFVAAQATDDDADTRQDTAAGLHCNSCNTCELCLALASFTWAVSINGAFTPHAAPLGQGTRFSSADSASGLKPPIS